MNEDLRITMAELESKTVQECNALELLFQEFWTNKSEDRKKVQAEFIEFLEPFSCKLNLEDLTAVFGLFYLYKTDGKGANQAEDYDYALQVLEKFSPASQFVPQWGEILAARFSELILAQLKPGSNTKIIKLHTHLEQGNAYLKCVGVKLENTFWKSLLNNYTEILEKNDVFVYNKYIAVFVWNYLYTVQNDKDFSYNLAWEILVKIIQNIIPMSLSEEQKNSFYAPFISIPVPEELKLDFFLLVYKEIIKINPKKQDKNIAILSKKFQQFVQSDFHFFELCKQASETDFLLTLLQLQAENEKESFSLYLHKVLQVLEENPIATEQRNKICDILLTALSKKGNTSAEQTELFKSWNKFSNNAIFNKLAEEIVQKTAIACYDKVLLDNLSNYYDTHNEPIPGKLELMKCLLSLQEELNLEEKQLKKRWKSVKYSTPKVTLAKQKEEADLIEFCKEYGKMVGTLFSICSNPAIIEIYHCDLELSDDLLNLTMENEITELLLSKKYHEFLLLLGWLLQNELEPSFNTMIALFQQTNASVDSLYKNTLLECRKVVKCINEYTVFGNYQLDRQRLCRYMEELYHYSLELQN